MKRKRFLCKSILVYLLPKSEKQFLINCFSNQKYIMRKYTIRIRSPNGISEMFFRMKRGRKYKNMKIKKGENSIPSFMKLVTIQKELDII